MKRADRGLNYGIKPCIIKRASDIELTSYWNQTKTVIGREMLIMRMRHKKSLGILLGLTLVLGMVSFISVTANADTDYALKVGGVQVTQEHSSGEGWSYDNSSHTLTLNGANITTMDIDSAAYIIYSDPVDALKIKLIGENTIGGVDSEAYYGIESYAGIEIEGTGSLEIKGTEIGIDSYDDIVISSGKITIDKCYGHAISTEYSKVIINGGEVVAIATARGEGKGEGIEAEEVYINGGSLIAVGGDEAIDAIVKNAIEGTGWDDIDGTEGKSDIDTNTDEGHSLDYKKVKFPADKDSDDDKIVNSDTQPQQYESNDPSTPKIGAPKTGDTIPIVAIMSLALGIGTIGIAAFKNRE